MKNELGDFLREIRGQMSLRDFAAKCDLSHTHLDSIEKGFDPRTKMPVRITVDMLRRIADGIGVDLITLVRLADPKSSESAQSAIRYSGRWNGSIMQEERIRIGKSVEEVAEAVGITVEEYLMCEKGTFTPSVNLLFRLGDYFHFSLDSLLGYTGIPCNKDGTPYRINYPTLQKISDAFSILNEEGQLKILNYTEDLLNSGRYTHAQASAEKHA